MSDSDSEDENHEPEEYEFSEPENENGDEGDDNGAACDFYFPYGLGAGPEGARWSLRPTTESSVGAHVRALPPPRFDADGLTLRWRQPVHADGAASSAATVTNSTTDSSTTTTVTSISADEDGEALDATVEDASREAEPAADARPSDQDSPSPTSQARPLHKHVVFIVSGRMAPSLTWRELKQTADNWMELSESQRQHMRAVSVLAVSAVGPVARAATCVIPPPSIQRHPETSLEDGDFYDEDNSSDEDDEHDDDAGSAAETTPDNSLRRLSFEQLRGTVQNGVLLRALLKDRTTAKHLVEDAAQEDEADEDDDEEDEEDEDVLLDRRRLDLVKRLLGAGHGRGRGGGGGRGRDGKAPAPGGWGLHLVGVWAAGGGARLPRARVSWTAPRGVAETLVNWAVPALRISGSRVVSGASQAEVPLVEQHATRVTVGDAHSSDVSPALVLQLSVKTDSSATAGVEDGFPEDTAAVPAPAPAAPEQVAAAPRAPSYEQAALWEATLVAVGLVVGAAALCVALFLAAYGVHSRVARCCRGRGHGIHAGMSGIHAKSASVEPLNAPDQNNV
ncbi:Abnormal spindle-like microcephaly-associated protein-like protein [Frankliniella fusca]|uniref:Abnormal spindle-like microcephaly-associated protein-like protein n=1 Tax=Frankliniella fusca TaxID=407009 RepID=A0AAE1H569_9NEOP|nr:Abnormal spindle-like microcephaly-associated protein-like protein [Frankliniella fusca]